jgi:hypothetical protein
MLDLIHHVLTSDNDINSKVKDGANPARVYPYFREPDEATIYPAIYFEQDGSNTQHVLTSNTATEGVAYDSFTISVSCVAPTLAEAWTLFHFVRLKLTTTHNLEVELGDNSWKMLDGVFDEVQIDLIFGGDLAVAEGRFEVYTQYELI